MSASRWPITPLLLYLFSTATSSPVSISTSAPPLPSQISPPSPLSTVLPSLLSPSLSVTPPFPSLSRNNADLTEKDWCSLTISPSTLVVRFGDPVTANCSLLGARMGFLFLGWKVPMKAPESTHHHFLVWSVDRMTEWGIKPTCWVASDQTGQCELKLPLIVFKPPDNVSISFVNHTGPMLEGHQYTLQCIVQDVAPVEHLTVTFYKGATELAPLQSINTNTTPVTEIFTLNITPTKDDDGVLYWCKATLELGPAGPRHPPVVRSQKLTATVLYGPQIICPTKLQVRQGESLSCEVKGNPKPSVTWFRDGQVFALPNHSSRQHDGHYTVSAKGLGQKNFTVEVEVIPDSGTANSCNRLFLLAILLLQTIIWQ
ncbi:hemicentin-2-like [Labrus mixtus]|uniref:hemicentin-2-like n=1 Tax=Labrus mixtus TaxID=508554 RepID=UPI0029C09704|nr:hemicentin-2-like [Labrus mixtus]